MSVSYWQDTAGTSINRACDVAIIGAGLAGMSTAYWLTKLDPTLSVVVADKGRVGHGASGRNAGFITCGSTEHFSRMSSAYGEHKAEQIWHFTEYNHKLLLEEFDYSLLASRCDYRRNGSWTLAATEHEAEVIQQTVDLLKSKGVKATWRDQGFVSQYMKCENFYGGACYLDDGEIHPVKYLHHLLGSLRGDVSLLENTEVFGVDSKGPDVVLRVNGGTIKSQAAILCTNAWSGQLFPWFADKIAPTRGQIIVTEPVERFLAPCYCSFVLDYFRQLADGRVLIGGFRNVDVEKEVGFSDEVNPIIHQKLVEFLNKHFPLLRGKKIDYQWSGVMGFAADGYPMIGSLTEDPRLFYNVGFTAHGLGFTFGTGQLTAKLILEGHDPGIFSGRRFP